jgi:hypothetical protein
VSPHEKKKTKKKKRKERRKRQTKPKKAPKKRSRALLADTNLRLVSEYKKNNTYIDCEF